MTYTVAVAQKDDWTIIQKLNHELFQEEYKRGHDKALDLMWPTGDAGEKYFRLSVSNPAKCALIARDQNGSPVGYVIGSAKNKFPYRKYITGELENMIVLRIARRKKVGTMLIDALKKWMADKGVNTLYVSAYAKNTGAIAFYTSYGFTTEGIGLEIAV